MVSPWYLVLPNGRKVDRSARKPKSRTMHKSPHLSPDPGVNQQAADEILLGLYNAPIEKLTLLNGRLTAVFATRWSEDGEPEDSWYGASREFWIDPLGSKGLLYMGGVGNEGNPKLIYSDGESRCIVVYINGHMVLRYPIYRYLDPRGPRVMGTIRIQAPKASTMPGDLAKKVILERLQTLGFQTHGDEVRIQGVDSSAESLEVFVGKLLEISLVKATVSRNLNLGWDLLVE